MVHSVDGYAIGVLHGCIGECCSRAYPSVFANLGDDEIMDFIISNANITTKNNEDLTDEDRSFGKETNWDAGLIIGIVFAVVSTVIICFYIFRWKSKQLAPNQPSTRVELHLDVDNEIILLVRSFYYQKIILKCFASK